MEVITEPGKYRVKICTGEIKEIDVTRRNGRLGVYLRLMDEFVRVDNFVGVGVLCRLD